MKAASHFQLSLSPFLFNCPSPPLRPLTRPPALPPSLLRHPRRFPLLSSINSLFQSPNTFLFYRAVRPCLLPLPPPSTPSICWPAASFPPPPLAFSTCPIAALLVSTILFFSWFRLVPSRSRHVGRRRRSASVNKCQATTRPPIHRPTGSSSRRRIDHAYVDIFTHIQTHTSQPTNRTKKKLKRKGKKKVKKIINKKERKKEQINK